MHQMFKVPVSQRGIILLSMASFSSSDLRRIKQSFLINFSRLQQKVFPKRLLSYLLQLKQTMMTKKVMTKNGAYCGFQG